MASTQQTPSASGSAEPAEPSSGEVPAPSRRRVIRSLSRARLAKHQEAADNAGVVYLSRVPPFMKPATLRNLLSGMGTEVKRIYLAAESQVARSGRVRAGGNKKKSYTEGWVEFDNKRRAKRIATMLNNTPIGGGNRGFHAYDLWNIKYLHKFKWSHLTEKMAYEARIKRDKMLAELSAAKKESTFYLRKVEQAKAIDAMEERKRKRGGAASSDADAAAAAGGEAKRARGATPDEAADDAMQNVRRRFKQRKVAAGARVVRDTQLLGSLLGGTGARGDAAGAT